MRNVDEQALRSLERSLHAEIPLTQAMGVVVAHYDQHGLTLRAPLGPNLNHKKTAFGGSLNSLATLACWGLAQLLVRDLNVPVTVVIQESHVQYLKPVEQNIEATCHVPPAVMLDRFLRTLVRHGRARIELDATIQTGSETAVRFHGLFVAYDKARFAYVQPM
jgi:thioesterase domain-containing protein